MTLYTTVGLSFGFQLFALATVATSPTENTSTNSIKLFYTVAPPAIGVVLLVAVIIHLYRRHKRRMSSVARRSLVQSGNPPTPPSTRPISWGPRVSYGQFGCVWRATYENNDVAVKVILAQERASWETERNMYENYSLVHENILKFYRAEKRLVECNMFQYWIITQYHNHGSLSDYLRSNSLNFDGMLRLMISMVKGLAFLHTENLLLNPPKPIIAHRDFKSRNVLVRDDLTCCISDFGSACAFSDTYESDDTKSQVRIIFSVFKRFYPNTFFCFGSKLNLIPVTYKNLASIYSCHTNYLVYLTFL